MVGWKLMVEQMRLDEFSNPKRTTEEKTKEEGY